MKCLKEKTAAMFAAAYSGSSMYPTLREPEMMEILPYGRQPVREGDVVFFRSPDGGPPVVHRVVRIATEGLTTRGDNNPAADAFRLPPGNIQGRVVAIWRGSKRRTITGGRPGLLRGRFLHWRLRLGQRALPALHPLYRGLSRRGWMARLLPPRFRPRIVVFHTRGQDQHLLLLGKRLIGRYDDDRRQWQIKRPFHLIVEGRALQTPQDRHRTNRAVLAGQRQTTPPDLQPGLRYALALADGCRWEITGADAEAEAMVFLLCGSMRLQATTTDTDLSGRGKAHQLRVHVDAHTAVADCYVPLASAQDGSVDCFLSPCEDWGGPFVNLVRLSLILARESQARGGVLLHGALAERDGAGVILAAPGGTGKSTASNRIPAPWRSLCDDTTLVVRDAQGRYLAHPWPTWSRFQDGGPGGAWDVQHAVPLKGIFFLAQATDDLAEPVGPGQAVSLLVEGLQQASRFMPMGLFQEEVRALHLEGFNNLSALARTIPAHILHISLTGEFWKELDRVLESGGT